MDWTYEIDGVEYDLKHANLDIYLNGWFVTSVRLVDLSPEVRAELDCSFPEDFDRTGRG